MKEPLRAQIAAAARRRGISLNAEAVDRLERSIQNEEAMGGPEPYALFRMLGAAAEFVETKTGKAWSEDWETFLAVRAAWHPLINAARPSPPKLWKDAFEELEREEKALQREERELPKQPTMPTMKVLPGQGYFSKRSDAQLREYENALADYDKQVREFNRERSAYDRKLKAYGARLEKLRSHFDELTELGKGIAAGLLQPEARK
ncbi:MAG: hypothetical protein IH905_11145 [Proteobacteria bacterium]|nr:hypothetical protein [Pseudomonadota bacterium]